MLLKYDKKVFVGCLNSNPPKGLESVFPPPLVFQGGMPLEFPVSLDFQGIMGFPMDHVPWVFQGVLFMFFCPLTLKICVASGEEYCGPLGKDIGWL